MTNDRSATGFGHKATAFTVLLGASALFLVMVVWPVAAPFMTMEFAPANSVESSRDETPGSSQDRTR